MKHTCTAVVVTLALGSTAICQDLVYYKFDSVGSPTIVNYASSDAAASTTTPTYGPTNSYAKGRFGPGALAAAIFGVVGNFVDSGWRGPHSGSATFSFFLKNRYANAATIRSGFVGRKGFGISTGGEAKGGLMMKGWGGQVLHAHFGKDLCFIPGWHHYAIVIDAKAKRATWYFDGKPHKSEAIASGVRLLKSDPLWIGRDHIDHCGSRFDMDEFRFAGRAASATEIQAWATRHQAASGAYGSDPVRDDDLVTNGRPVLGNSSFGLRVSAEAATPFALGWGLSRVRFGSLVLPLDLGEKRTWHTSVELFVPGVVGSTGVAELPVPIPQDVTLDQVSFHTQVVLATRNAGFTVSNAIAHTIGH